MFAVFALASAALYGAADFIGGFTARRADTLVVVVISQFAGLVVVGLALPWLPAATRRRQTGSGARSPASLAVPAWRSCIARLPLA